MGCDSGCAAKAKSKAQRMRACYAMCRYCPERNLCPTYAQCVVNGKFARLSVVRKEPDSGGTTCKPKTRVETLACPLGRWPDPDGQVRWRGCVWYGVPFPIRLRVALAKAWAVFRESLGAQFLPGCGCLKSLKDRWKRWRGHRED